MVHSTNSGRARRIAIATVLVLAASLVVTGGLEAVNAANAKRANPGTPAPMGGPRAPSGGVPHTPAPAAPSTSLLRSFPAIVVPQLGASVNSTNPSPVVHEVTYTVALGARGVLFTVSKSRDLPLDEKHDKTAQLQEMERLADLRNGQAILRWIGLVSRPAGAAGPIADHLATDLRERISTLGGGTHPLLCTGAGGATGCPELNAALAAVKAKR